MGKLLKDIANLPIAFGGAAISGEGGGYGFGEMSKIEAIDLLLYAFEKGVRIFDSAPIYGFGESEKRMGEAFKNIREKVFLVSKCGVTWHENKRVDMNNDPLIAKKMLEQSLRDFNSDYIDLYMVHWPDSRVDIRKTLEVLAKAKLEGKIKHIGLCNTTIEELNKASEIDRIEVVQSEFNIFNNRFIKDEMFPYLNEKEISFMSWGTLDKGILTGRVDEKRKAFDKSDCRSWAPWWKNSNNKEKFQAMKKIWPILDRYEVSGLDMALMFNLSHQELDVAICGARNFKQLDEVLASSKLTPMENLLKEINEIASNL